MLINVIITDGKTGENNNPEVANNLGGKIHDNLRGNQDYIDCGIVLNIDTPKNPESNTGEVTLVVGLEDCKDKIKALDLLETSIKIIRQELEKQL